MLTKPGVGYRPRMSVFMDTTTGMGLSGATGVRPYLPPLLAGQDVIAHVAVPNLPRPMVARLAAGHPLSAKLARGQQVWLNWQADQAVILKD